MLGTCTAEETTRVQALCAKYPEILAEVEAIEEALLTYAAGDYTDVPDFVKENIFKKINSGQVYPELSPVSKESTPVRKLYMYAAAASVAFAVMSLSGNIVLYAKLQKASTELSTLNKEKEYYAEQFKNQQTSLKMMESNIALLSDPSIKIISLKSTDPASNFSAVIHWNSSKHSTYISMAQLPEPPSGKQYQLWAIVDGKPVDAGVFGLADAASIYLQKMKEISGAQAFAITLENEGGSPVPTLTAMQVLGNV